MIDDAQLERHPRDPAPAEEPEQSPGYRVSSRALVLASLVTATALAYLLLSTLGNGNGGGGGRSAAEEGRFLPDRYVTRETDTIPSVATLHAVDEQLVLDANGREASDPLQPGTVLVIPAAPTDGRSLPAEIEENPDLIRRMTRLIPFRRVAQPEDQASAVSFLISDDASYITGQVISVSGGLTMVD